MAVVQWVEEDLTPGQYPPGVRVFKWPSLAGGDTGVDLVAPDYSDKSLQVVLEGGGAFGTSTALMRGHNYPVPAGAVYGTVRDTAGGAVSGITTDGALRQLADNPYALSPQVAAGTGTGISFRLVCNKVARR